MQSIMHIAIKDNILDIKHNAGTYYALILPNIVR